MVVLVLAVNDKTTRVSTLDTVIVFVTLCSIVVVYATTGAAVMADTTSPLVDVEVTVIVLMVTVGSVLKVWVRVVAPRTGVVCVNVVSVKTRTLLT